MHTPIRGLSADAFKGGRKIAVPAEARDVPRAVTPRVTGCVTGVTAGRETAVTLGVTIVLHLYTQLRGRRDIDVTHCVTVSVTLRPSVTGVTIPNRLGRGLIAGRGIRTGTLEWVAVSGLSAAAWRYKKLPRDVMVMVSLSGLYRCSQTPYYERHPD